MITIHQLLRDPIYKEFFCNPPKKTHFAGKITWRLYILKKGATVWAYKDFESYAEAFAELRKRLKTKTVKDAAIGTRNVPYKPPMRTVKIKGKYVFNAKGEKQQVTKRVLWQPELDGEDFDFHRWCDYCRRPTMFDYYNQHPALNHLAKSGITDLDPTLLRCCICGTSERILDPVRR